MKSGYLPVGTVCLLKGGTKKVMITGFCSIPKENPKEMYDYNGCLYPEGFLNSSQVCVFNNDQIDKILYLGFEDDEEKKFKENLDRIMKKIKETTNNNDGIEKFDVES